MCDANSGEDPQCSYQISLIESSAGDHNDYMGVQQDCSSADAAQTASLVQ
eukprot:gene4506-3122_t